MSEDGSQRWSLVNRDILPENSLNEGQENSVTAVT